MLILCSLALLQVQATGLNPGESLVELSPIVTPADAGLRYGRLRDAFTGKPVAGAVVETWSEENDSPMGGLFRFGEATSGEDGRFAVQGTLGDRQAEKVRVRAAGYLTLSVTLGDIENDMVIFPAPAEPTRVRVLDVHDQPISDVLFTSTHTCAHDVPAFSVHSNALGWATLAEYGMQDAVQELRLRATGFGAIKYLDGNDVFQSNAPAVRLKRRVPVSYTLLAKDGEPWSGANLMIMDDDGHHVVRTGKDGGFTIASRYGRAPFILYNLESPQQRYLATVPIAPGRTLTVRDAANDWGDDVPTGTLFIEPSTEEPLDIWVCHQDGWLESVSEKDYAGFEFPEGEGFLLVGGPFSGFERSVIGFKTLAGGSVRVPVILEPEPRVRVITPESEYAELWIQSAGESTDRVPLDEAISVPGTGELCVLYQSGGEVRRRCVHSATDGQVIDLRPAETIVRSTPSKHTSGTYPFTFPEEADLEVISPEEDCILSITAPGQASVSGPAGTPFLLQLSADDHPITWARDRIPPALSPAIPRSLHLTPYAKLEVVAPPGTEFIGFESNDFQALAPGPLGIVARMPDGKRFGLQLQLEPGARRSIEILLDEK